MTPRYPERVPWYRSFILPVPGTGDEGGAGATYSQGPAGKPGRSAAVPPDSRKEAAAVGMLQWTAFECDGRGCDEYLEVSAVVRPAAVFRACSLGWAGQEYGGDWFCPDCAAGAVPGPHESWCPALRTGPVACCCRGTRTPALPPPSTGVQTVRVRGELL